MPSCACACYSTLHVDTISNKFERSSKVIVDRESFSMASCLIWDMVSQAKGAASNASESSCKYLLAPIHRLTEPKQHPWALRSIPILRARIKMQCRALAETTAACSQIDRSGRNCDIHCCSIYHCFQARRLRPGGYLSVLATHSVYCVLTATDTTVFKLRKTSIASVRRNMQQHGGTGCPPVTSCSVWLAPASERERG